MRKSLAVLSLALLGSALAAEPEGGDASLEELLRQELRQPSGDLAVSTAARMAQSGAAAPGVTHVVTRQDIQRLGLRNLADILQLLPGVYLTRDGLFTQMGVRGLGRPGDLNARVLFLLDGMRLNENIYDAGQIDQDFLVDVSEIERVEFSPGSGSALYGNNAFVGVLQVITQRADQNGGVRLRGTLGPHGSWTTSASLARRLDSGAEWGVSVSRLRDHELPLPDRLPEGQEPAWRAHNWDRADRFNLRWLAGGLTLRLGAVNRVHGLPTVVAVPEDAPPELGEGRDRTRIQYAQWVWTQRIARDWDLHLAHARQELLYRNDEPTREDGGDDDVLRFEALGQWDITEARLAGPLNDDHELMLGLEHQRDRQQRLRYFYVSQPDDGNTFRGRRTGVFVQDSWTLAPRQRLLLGLRHDRGPDGGRSNPRLAYSWADDAGRQFKLSMGNAFRAPNRSEALSNQYRDLAPPPAERIRSMEAVWAAPLGERWRYRVVLFSGRIKNLIDVAPDGGGSYQASPAVRSRGLEAELDGRWGEGGNALIWMAVQRSRYADGSELDNSPHLLLGWRFWHPLGTRLRLAMQGQAISRRDGADLSLPGYAAWHGHLQWQAGPQLEVFLGVRNIGGRRHLDAPSVAGGSPTLGPGRQIHVGFQWRLDP